MALGELEQANAYATQVGYAFSYHAQYNNMDGRYLKQHPWRPSGLEKRLKSTLFNIIKTCRDSFLQSYQTTRKHGIAQALHRLTQQLRRRLNI
jgi:hypothetical protein